MIMRTKRVEYDKGLFVINEELEAEITSKAKEFVNDIVNGIGKEYVIHDLEPIIVGNVIVAIADKVINEYEMQMM
jgi:hypothetical protein